MVPRKSSIPVSILLRMSSGFRLPAVSLLIMAAVSACNAVEPPAHLRIAGAEPERGRRLIQSYGCGTCHTIEGVRGARGTVGPTLNDYAARNLLAGILPNTPRTLVAWLIDPVAVDPRTGMPAMGLTEAEARHVAAYLYTLGASRAQVYPSGPPLDLDASEKPALPNRGQPIETPGDATPSPTKT
jgi:mono/diheme cytochrome c family protein